MLKVLIIISVLIISVTGQQDPYNWGHYNYPTPNTEDKYINAGQQWPDVLPGNYFERAGIRKKPCPNRRSRNQNVPTNDQWIRTFHWKSAKPLPRQLKPINNMVLAGNNLQYQSLKGTDPIVVENKKDVHVNVKILLKCLTTGYQNGDPEQEQNQPGMDNDAYVDNNYGDTIKFMPTTSISKHDTTENIVVSEKCDKMNGKQKQESPEEILSPSRRFLTDTDDDDVSTDSDELNTQILNDKKNKKYDKVKELNNQFNNDRQKPTPNVNHTPRLNNLDKGVTNDKIPNINVNRQNNVDQKLNKKPKVNVENRQDLGNTRSGQDKARVGRHELDTAYIERQLLEPIRGVGLTNMSTSRMALMASSRICYACSSASDGMCWSPTKRTLVKYCRKGRDACVTRTYKSQESNLIVIRDCSDSCDSSLPILGTTYKSCSICKSDLCNNQYVERSSGYSISSYNAMFTMFLALFARCVFQNFG